MRRPAYAWVVEFIEIFPRSANHREVTNRWYKLGRDGYDRQPSGLADALNDLHREQVKDRESQIDCYRYRVRNYKTGQIVMVAT